MREGISYGGMIGISSSEKKIDDREREKIDD